jgi:type II secretory pathway pseudopilin PulG
VSAARRARQRGYSLVALMAGITLMSIAIAVALPAWKYVIQNEREEELLFRGGQIADAIRRFQTKNGNALPASMEVLVKGKFLRKAYKDPMTKDGEWRLIRQGETLGGAAGGPRAPGAPSASPLPGASPRPSPSPSPGGLAGRLGTAFGAQSVGVFVGVATKATGKSIRLFNNRDQYEQWWFIAGQPRVVGRTVVSPQQTGPGQGLPQGRPGGTQQPAGPRPNR